MGAGRAKPEKGDVEGGGGDENGNKHWLEGGPLYQQVIICAGEIDSWLQGRVWTEKVIKSSRGWLLKDIYKVRKGSYSQSRQPVLASSGRTLNLSQLGEVS